MADDTDDTPAGAPASDAPKPKKAKARKSAVKKTAANKTPAAPKPTPPSEDPVPQGLQHMPVNLFGAALGLAGFAAAWREAAVAYGAGGLLAKLLAGGAAGVFTVLVVLYAIKLLRHRDAVRAEFRHPVQGNFFAAATMTLMVLASNLITPAPGLATVLWAVGATANLAITIAMVSFWFSRDCHVSHATPVWFIPVVGNLIVPIVGAPLGYTEIGWMLFAVGLLFWIVLFVIVFYRLLFEKPLEHPLRPSLCILITPPSLCFIAHTVLSGGVVDGVSQMFLGIALFMALIVAPQLPVLLRHPFGLGWWSLTFPLAALSVACTLYADAVESGAADALAIGTIALTTVIVLVVTLRTVRYILAGKVFRPVEAPLPTP